MAKPKPQTKGPTAVQVRLDDERLDGLDRLVAERQEALRGEGVEVTRASVLRGLLDRALEKRKTKPKR